MICLSGQQIHHSNEHPQLRKATAMIKTWYEQGEEKGKRTDLVSAFEAFQSMTEPVRALVEAKVNEMEWDKLEELAVSLMDLSKNIEDLG